MDGRERLNLRFPIEPCGIDKQAEGAIFRIPGEVRESDLRQGGLRWWIPRSSKK
jgi:hypothetical protein